MTGRAAGYCAGYGMPGYMNPYGGRMGGGFGYPGRGIPGAYAAPYYGWGGYRGRGRSFGFGFGRGRRGRW